VDVEVYYTQQTHHISCDKAPPIQSIRESAKPASAHLT